MRLQNPHFALLLQAILLPAARANCFNEWWPGLVPGDEGMRRIVKSDDIKICFDSPVGIVATPTTGKIKFTLNMLRQVAQKTGPNGIRGLETAGRRAR